MVLYLWWTQPRAGTGIGYGRGASPARMAAYEQMWRQEEDELWRWLDSRVGGAADAIHDAVRADKPVAKQKAAAGQREMEEALRLTREKMQVLEAMIKSDKERAGVS